MVKAGSDWESSDLKGAAFKSASTSKAALSVLLQDVDQQVGSPRRLRKRRARSGRAKTNLYQTARGKVDSGAKIYFLELKRDLLAKLKPKKLRKRAKKREGRFFKGESCSEEYRRGLGKLLRIQGKRKCQGRLRQYYKECRFLEDCGEVVEKRYDLQEQEREPPLIDKKSQEKCTGDEKITRNQQKRIEKFNLLHIIQKTKRIEEKSLASKENNFNCKNQTRSKKESQIVQTGQNKFACQPRTTSCRPGLQMYRKYFYLLKARFAQSAHCVFLFNTYFESLLANFKHSVDSLDPQQRYHMYFKLSELTSQLSSKMIAKAKQAYFGLTDREIRKIERIRNYARDLECVICMNPLGCGERVMRLPCRHVFHSDCIHSWFLKNQSCPLCRVNLRQRLGVVKV